MEEEYNWNLILKVAVPISLIEAYTFYTNASDNLKWFSLTAGLMPSLPEIGHQIGPHLKNCGLIWRIPQVKEYVPGRIYYGFAHRVPSNLPVRWRAK